MLFRRRRQATFFFSFFYEISALHKPTLYSFILGVEFSGNQYNLALLQQC